jgi:hypothetical protein
VLELPTTNFTHFEDVLDVYANTIRLPGSSRCRRPQVPV